MTILIKSTPWDTAALGLPTWELTEYSEQALQQAVNTPGHHTIKLDSLSNKRLLQDYGFYYCDTLIEPYCNVLRLRKVKHPEATISRKIDVVKVMLICHEAFEHGRFHRDFNLPKAAADLRYDNWLQQLLEAKQVYGLYWQGELAGFIAYNGNNLVLHAIAESQRGKGLSKFWWSEVCTDLLAMGNQTVTSSISASNLAVLNLYASLGFSFKHPQDIYHRVTQ